MKRREFICLLGGAVAVWPLVVRAQQPGQLRRVGMLIGYAENDPETHAGLAAFRQGLEHLGWTEGRNIRIDYRFAPAGPDQAQHCAKELVALRPDILVGNSTPATAALLLETHTVPIVFVGEWLRREHRAAGRQHHRFHQFRAVADRKVARAAQANRARHRARLLAVRHALPAIYPYRYEAADGGLLSYGVDTVDLLRRAAPYVDRILKGEKRPIFPWRRPSSSWSSICGPPRRPPTMSRLENAPSKIEIARLMAALVDGFCESYRRAPSPITLDIDDTCDTVHGHQQLSLFNAHYDERCFLPIPYGQKIDLRRLPFHAASRWQ